jgi:hypothetical protein
MSHRDPGAQQSGLRPNTSPAAVSGRTESRPLVAAVILFALILRLIHLSSAINSPLTYQPGTDEDYYQHFAQAVAAGHGSDNAEFAFMDPAYGYLLGAIFKVAGPNLFVVFVLQILLDTATVYGIVCAGRLLGRPRAGLIGGLLYGGCSIAIEFCTTLLKETAVSSFMIWWVVGALILLHRRSRWGWLLWGLYCALGVALRSTLMLLALFALLLPALASSAPKRADAGESLEPSGGSWPLQTALVLLGLMLGVLPWALRNEAISATLSPLPFNGGIVLHQVYNEQNPSAQMWIPAFVNYSHPSEIWRGYAGEASRREGAELSPAQVDRYWRHETMGYMEHNPGRVALDIVRKNLLWFASTEIPSSRSDAEEQMFSPVLRWLPPPGIWLMALGLAGLFWLALEDRRWCITLAPVLVAWLACVVFFPESRFRFHAASALALGAGLWVHQFLSRWRRWTDWQVCLPVALAIAVLTASVALGRAVPLPPPEWDRVAWGYIKMGNLPAAQSVVARELSRQPANGALLEADGYIAAAEHRYDDAAADLQRAIELRPRSHLAHYNLARVYLRTGSRTLALQEARIATQLKPSADYQALVQELSTALP